MRKILAWLLGLARVEWGLVDGENNLLHMGKTHLMVVRVGQNLLVQTIPQELQWTATRAVTNLTFEIDIASKKTFHETYHHRLNEGDSVSFILQNVILGGSR